MEMKYGCENYSADILVVGGGIAGLTAAVSIKENNPELSVLLVEKQTSGYSGKANKGGGVLQYFELDRMKPEDFASYHVHAIGCFLGDQELMMKYVSMNHHMLDKLAEWGARLPKREDGSYQVIPTGPMTAMIGVDLDITLKVRQTAEKLGVKIMDKVTVSDLLTSEGKIAGAVGYSILDGTFYTFNAKAVVLATGSQNYRIGSMWSNGRGDGIAAAYRAGAEMRNPEFGNFCAARPCRRVTTKSFSEKTSCINKNGEHITKNFRTSPEPDISSTAICGMVHTDVGQPRSRHRQAVKNQTAQSGGLAGVWHRPYGQRFWMLERGQSAEKTNQGQP